jgi:hypothetical protein
LVEKAKESPAHGVDALAAIGALLGLGQNARDQERANELFQVGEALLAQVLHTAA